MVRPKKEVVKKKNFSGYFPEELYDALSQDAEDEHRSIHGHVVYILEQYLKKKNLLK
jgi:hypothetical protein